LTLSFWPLYCRREYYKENKNTLQCQHLYC